VTGQSLLTYYLMDQSVSINANSNVVGIDQTNSSVGPLIDVEARLVGTTISCQRSVPTPIGTSLSRLFRVCRYDMNNNLGHKFCVLFIVSFSFQTCIFGLKSNFGSLFGPS
jgi:hypothetical protein